MRRAPFPVWATLIPVVAALIMWAITQSPFVLMFAALGPLGALATRIDRRRAERVERRERELDERQHAADAERARADGALEARRASWSSVFTVDDILANEVPHARNRDIEMVIGVADGCPITLPSQERVGVVGLAWLAEAFARTIAIQQRHSGGRGSVLVAPALAELGACDAVITLDGPARARLQRGPGPALGFAPHFVAQARAQSWLEQHGGTLTAPSRGVAVSFGRSHAGVAHTIDIAAGPHALVAGTTGSGKTELLRAWVHALCQNNSPTELAIVAIDFKGGTGLESFTVLPHLADLVTDIGTHSIARVFRALQGEITRRERLLAAHRARSFDELEPGLIPRLIILIDEFQVIVDQHRSATDVCADIAARGRALGIHLILSTQHPSRAVRDTIAANCGLRVALRLIDPAESHALLGDQKATGLVAPGEAVSRDDRGLTQWRVSAVTDPEIAALAQRWQAHPRASAPWLPTVPVGEPLRAWASETATGALALIDRVDLRTYEPLDANRFTALRVSGGPASGKTTVLRRLAECAEAAGVPVIWVSNADIAAAWTAIESALNELQQRTHTDTKAVSRPPLIVADDFDALQGRLDPEYRQLCVERLRTLRQRHGARLAISSRSPAPQDELASEHIELGARGTWRMREFECFGVDTPWRPPLPPAPPLWQPHGVVGVVTDHPLRIEHHARKRDWCFRDVPRMPDELARVVSEGAAGVTLVIGSTEQWLMHRHGVAGQAGIAGLLFPDGHPADLRALRRQRMLPPVLGPGEAWWVSGDSPAVRVALADELGAD